MFKRFLVILVSSVKSFMTFHLYLFYCISIYLKNYGIKNCLKFKL